ncbi:MAG: NADPH-dependent assimilatory sulfite reductase hemoprotein subunit [Chitinophagaceae bacterium]|nr:NADPH-dependent assimilatory sulfite reductase hemoprotein subunit [Chitinophagaceae bacterium]MCA6453387.1 NADPH-dependent assimilatory sulfite reductase hemoprotein subunit [Chitinophagaceae bacterium]MCA6456356.1 NADPH-dependent assimilatory sulfite reductase hemoprotein subunit [Chitinophagaceae bacterium]MCA6457744.1 NADPH-dependent assimilatory sulfite reductase hemoprotein subunit [Chitinophagaceae bacterium]MCA6463457.1 NADPH-dependent assimilatory sulfite reductase hemoprotein subun
MSKKSAIEIIKEASDGLRGTIRESLRDEITGAIREDDQALIKFHGMYQQDDRDRREERAAKKLERLYSFMIRLRLPGGFLTPAQWIAVHEVAGENATGVIKITSRQTLQLHGMIKSKIKPTIKAFNEAKLDSIATCGDINRNVLCSSHPKESPIHEEVFGYADKISRLLMPRTRAYYEIWLDDEPLLDKKEEEDPLYQDRYLPRKFKIAIAIPPNNDVDVFANDIGLIAVISNGHLEGFNIAIGGGLSSTHGNPDTYPRLATLIGFVPGEEKTLKVVYEIAAIQRDHGNRSDRKLARLKYTLDRLGVDWFREELERRVGFALEPVRTTVFTSRKDHFGWHQNAEGLWYYTVLVENGRVTDTGTAQVKSALLAIAHSGKANFRFTCNQNVIISDVKASDKAAIEAILDAYGVILLTEKSSVIRRHAMACVALPTCPLALAEAQRYLPTLLDKMEPLLQKHQLQQEEIIIRMTGCPNGCARSYAAEIGLVGTGPGRYNLQLGGDRIGQRLNQIYQENIGEEEILASLDGLLESYAAGRLTGESFGDFAIRKQWVSSHDAVN